MDKEQYPLLEQAIQRFKLEQLSPYCLERCTKTCCFFDQHFKNLFYGEEVLMAVLGVSTLTEKQRHHYSALFAYCITVPEVYEFADGLCPQYDSQSRLCKIYHHPHRPKGCESYPLRLEEERGITFVSLKLNCVALEQHQQNPLFDLHEVEELAAQYNLKMIYSKLGDKIEL